MSLLNALANRPAVPPVQAGAITPVVQGAQQQMRAAVEARQALAASAAGTNSSGAADSEDSDSVTLSRQALNKRVDQLGDRTIEVAQRFLEQFAASLFGDAAKGASFNFDAVSVSADTSLSAATVQGTADGVAYQGAALRFEASSAFVGHGTLQTNDGQSYEFTLEVAYRATASASASSVGASDAGTPDTTPAPTPEQTLVGKQLPPVKFPGSLADLFKLLGRQLDIAASGKDPEQDGQLSMRLIRLVNSAALLAPRAHPERAADPAANGRALSQYAAPAISLAPPAPLDQAGAIDATA